MRGNASSQCPCRRWWPHSASQYRKTLEHWRADSPSLSAILEKFDGATASSRAHTPASSLPRNARGGRCLTAECVASRLVGRWLMLVGDSTQRRMYDSLLGLLHRGLGFKCLMIQPHLDGMPVRDRDGHKDYDAICRLSEGVEGLEDATYVQRIPECLTGPPRPFSKCFSLFLCGNCSVAPWASNESVNSSVIVSFRFLRGLDLDKLAANALDWRQRYAYSEWRFRSARWPPTMFTLSDPVDAHDVTRMHLAWRHEGPDTILFHSCAWDLPKINTSNYYWPYMLDYYLGATCTNQQQLMQQQEKRGDGIWSRRDPSPLMRARMWPTPGGGGVNVTVGGVHWRRAVALGSACIRRGHTLSDDDIYNGFGERLRTALRHLQAISPRARLIVRTCHSGTQQSVSRPVPDRARVSKELPQLPMLQRMNSIIERTARRLCMEVLDVFTTDAAAGFFFGRREDFHVPPKGAAYAALALIARVTFGKNSSSAEVCA